ncbi:hypothetical protein HDU81_009658 [Chytriomyces hyalinus]|nr:hypothetical protein HDU81_009658 [Chytriomyces hyalinus]
MSSESFSATKLVAWTTTGAFLNVFARSMARLPIGGNPLSYVAYAAATGVFGYGVHSFEVSRASKLEQELDRLTKRRMLSLATDE